MATSDNHPGSDEEWATLLSQLRRQAEVQPRPFFYARVQARLAAGRRPAGFWLPGWARRPAYIALLGALGLALSRDGAALPIAASQYSSPLPTQVGPLPR